MDDHTKHVLDWLAIGTTVGTVAGWLPNLAALFTVVWTGIRIYEWVRGRRH